LQLDKAMTDANDEGLLRRLVAALGPAPGIEAIALGGSRVPLAELSAWHCAASFSPQETWEERWRD